MRKRLVAWIGWIGWTGKRIVEVYYVLGPDYPYLDPLDLKSLDFTKGLAGRVGCFFFTAVETVETSSTEIYFDHVYFFPPSVKNPKKNIIKYRSSKEVRASQQSVLSKGSIFSNTWCSVCPA